MMESTTLRRALAGPTLTRATLLEGFEHTVDPLPDRTHERGWDRTVRPLAPRLPTKHAAQGGTGG